MTKRAPIPMTNTSTNATTHILIWMTEVIELASVSVDEMERLCGRKRMHLWYSSGEPVWMAATSLRLMVEGGTRHEKADREVEALASRIRSSIRT